MKKTLKERLISVLKSDKEKFNRYVKFCLKITITFSADLSSADLSYADLSSADLRSADLSSGDLSYADLDFSCLDLSCKSLSFKSDMRIRTQIAFHFASLIKNSLNATDEEKEIYSKMLDYVNKFHRTDVERLTEIQ
jgi:uncharacterized protein YjbI with pentapeptide repeats